MLGHQGEVRVEAAGEDVVVRCAGDIDHDLSPDLDQALRQALKSAPVRTVVDLSEVRFADSAVLHSLLQAAREHQEADVQLVVAGPLGEVTRRLFEVTGSAEAFTFVDAPPSAHG
ncbi:STAS domain-containing protein [Streptomyces sp. NPDC060194]|uniref:STAS domain-containing protein n=1 Tax=Streptomyces sp. NPDC060194 TaxID=3347069 RepID=UPI00365D8EF3